MISKEELSKFYTPSKDKTNKVYLMKYVNNGLSYGLNKPGEEKQEFYLCKSPILCAEVTGIISIHGSFEELRNAFFEARYNDQNGYEHKLIF
jgi:hypothetical protein